MTVPGVVLKHLHRARLSHYRGAGGSDADALALYEWNIELTSALQELLGIAEVAVRHAIDIELRAWSVTHCGAEEWIDHVAALPYLSVAERNSTPVGSTAGGTQFRISAICKHAAIYGVSVYIAGFPTQRTTREAMAPGTRFATCENSVTRFRIWIPCSTSMSLTYMIGCFCRC